MLTTIIPFGHISFVVHLLRRDRLDANDTFKMDLMDGIRHMGRLIDSDWETTQDLMDFQSYLNTYDTNDTYYDTNAHMRSVCGCSSMLPGCFSPVIVAFGFEL